jgi:uncharacterized membrane protein YhaH (DUF805 family)
MNTSGQTTSGSAIVALFFAGLFLWARHRGHETGWSVLWAVCTCSALIGTAATLSVGGIFIDALVSFGGTLTTKFINAVHSVHVSK